MLFLGIFPNPAVDAASYAAGALKYQPAVLAGRAASVVPPH
jgi:hypothetical protein